MLSNVDFPAPEGPRIAVSCPDLNCPLIFLKISFDAETNNVKIYEYLTNVQFLHTLVVYYVFCLYFSNDKKLCSKSLCVIFYGFFKLIREI